MEQNSQPFSAYLEPNVGQFEPKIRYLSRNTSLPVRIGDAGIQVGYEADSPGFRMLGAAKHIQWQSLAADASDATGSAASGGVIEYVIGQAHSRTGNTQQVPAILRTRAQSRVLASQIYPGIDLEYRFQQNALELDFIVAPGSDYRQIRLQPEHGKAVIDSQGQLNIVRHGQRLVQKAPFAWQVVDGQRKVISSEWQLLSDGSAGFKLAKVDPALELVIDPVISMSGFLGDTGRESVRGITLDSTENIIIAGTAYNGTVLTGTSALTSTAVDCPMEVQDMQDGQADFPSSYEFDAFVAKYNSAGTIQWAKHLSGSCNEGFRDVYVDTVTNDIYVTGVTVSTNFPVQAALETVWTPGYVTLDDGTQLPLTDGIFAVFDSAGTLIRSSYFGGSGGDYGRTIIGSNSGNTLIISGNTTSNDFFAASETSGSAQPARGGLSDVFLMKVSGSSVTGTYLGGGQDDFMTRMIQAADNSFWITGITESANMAMPATGPDYRDHRGNEDAFVLNLSEDLTTINNGTFIGGSGDDGATDVAVTTDGSVYVLGATESNGIILDGVTLDDGSPYDGSPLANTQENSNWLGRYPLYQPLKRFTGSSTTYDGFGDTYTKEAFLTKFTPTLNKIEYSTFMHGSDLDSPVAMDIIERATPNRKEIYVLGQTESDDFFPLLSSMQARPAGNAMFFSRLIELDSLGRLCAFPAITAALAEDTDCQLANADTGMFSVLFGSDGIDVPYNMVTSAANDYSLIVGTTIFTLNPLLYPESIDYPVAPPATNLNTGFSGGQQDVVLTRFDHGVGSSGSTVDLLTSFIVQQNGKVTTGSELDFRVRVSLLAGGSVDNTRVVIQRPLSVTFSSVPGNCRQVNTYLYCDTGTLDGGTPEKDIDFSIRTRYRAGVSITASAHSWQADTDLANNTVSSRFTVVDPPNRSAMSWYLVFLGLIVGLYRRWPRQT